MSPPKTQVPPESLNMTLSGKTVSAEIISYDEVILEQSHH